MLLSIFALQEDCLFPFFYEFNYKFLLYNFCLCSPDIISNHNVCALIERDVSKLKS